MTGVTDRSDIIVGVDPVRACTAALHTALARAYARQPGINATSSLLDGFPAAVLVGMSPVFSLHSGDTLFHAERRLLSRPPQAGRRSIPTSG